MTRVVITLDFDQDDITQQDVINYLKELIDDESLDYEVQDFL